MNVLNSFLNKTPNKYPRASLTGADKGALPKFVVWHETASPNSRTANSSPMGTLNYNLSEKVGSSYNDLIARNGDLYPYVDARTYVAYHAGVNSSWLDYKGWEVNVWSIGRELDGPNDGTPITAAQIKTIEELMLEDIKQWGIPLTAQYHPEHGQVAPKTPEGRVYKTDPKGCNIAQIVGSLQERLQAKKSLPAVASLSGDVPVPAPVYEFWAASGGIWRADQFALGYYLKEIDEPGKPDTAIYLFERGALRLLPDKRVEGLLLAEAVSLIQSQ